MNLSDTIVAIATPPGRGGIGIVRLSGERAAEIARQLTRTGTELRSWVPTRGELLDDAGGVIDDVLMTFFAKPRSYTAEDVVEIACHGAPVVLRHGVERALRLGARLAEPGEFTLRAFVNGRIDLLQAEAVRDLIDATTVHQARVAAQQAGGAVARRIQPVKLQLIDLIALLEAGIDFAEDDISVAPDEELRRRLDPIQEEVQKLAHSFAYGQVLREGFSLAIIGRPNVGKSSLFNRLLKQDRAIVTDMPGTTRDSVAELTAIEGLPVRVIDTAGIREGESLAEKLGIERSFHAMADADLVLVIVDATGPLLTRDLELLERAREHGQYLLVANKCDLAVDVPGGAIGVSALTGQGIGALREAIIRIIAPDGMIEQSGAILSNLRQQQAADEAVAALAQARVAIDERIPHEMLLIDLYAVLEGLDALTGKTTAEDILNRIFSTFCIGK